MIPYPKISCRGEETLGQGIILLGFDIRRVVLNVIIKIKTNIFSHIKIIRLSLKLILKILDFIFLFLILKFMSTNLFILLVKACFTSKEKYILENAQLRQQLGAMVYCKKRPRLSDKQRRFFYVFSQKWVFGKLKRSKLRFVKSQS